MKKFLDVTSNPNETLQDVRIQLLHWIIIGFLYIQNKLSLDITLQEINTYPISWLTASAVFVFLGILIITSFGLIQKKMLNSLQLSKDKTKELKKLNRLLNEDILEKKKIENDLRNFQEGLEELVKERTAELEEKNKKLEEFNELFVDREFRIKELKDKVKELEK